ncbi:flagellar basal body FlaE [Halorhodospira abdelmalekii]|uniref:flagellar hook protein FlgE n=1 Tax=Halorhodospira abdelmalekii TaxID=421629 RepID=UPI0019076A9E|nr:flagellar hook protein FlgE [Halorhodospira abdelmalekii]MBK1734835.1 flagellar basal body FlaE [Halorhodospira abdelmalekii]
MSFNIALTGINSASKDLETTSNNLSNAGTTGFKKSRAEFNDLFAMGAMGVPNLAIGQGSRLANVGQLFNQGAFDFTERSLDLGVEGGGFFRLEEQGEITYSRAGEFEIDRDGYIVNNAGRNLTGFRTDDDGNRVGDGHDLLRVPTEGIAASATESAKLSANLNADAEVLDPALFDPEDTNTFNESTTTTFYDSQGSARDATFYFVKSGENQWSVFTEISGLDPDDQEALFGEPQVLEFDGAGNLLGDGMQEIEGEFAAQVEPLLAEIDFGGVTQFARPFNVTEISQDGYTAGEFENVNVEKDGTIYARYSNGERQAVGMVALTRFPSEERLQNAGQTSWQATAEAGDPLVGVPGEGRFGRIEAGALEQSNVEVSEQLVNMITAQRNFSANAKMISTQDQVTQEILQIR